MECVGFFTCILGWTLKNLVSVVATIIACCAMFSTYWQAKLTREHNRLSVMPHLIIENDYRQHDMDILFKIRNNGLGPAIITSYKMMINGEEVNTSDFNTVRDKLWELLKDGIPNNSFILALHFREKGESIAAGDDVMIMQLTKQEDVDSDLFDHEFINEQLAYIGFEINYESFYGEKYPPILFRRNI